MRVLRPLNVAPIVASVSKTGRLITVDTGFVRFGVGAEIIASVMTEVFDALKAAPVRLGLPDHPTPSSRGLIPGFYPDSQRIVREAGKILALDQAKVDSALKELDIQRKDLQIDQPDPFFKGPF
jgi:pyruvate dehydrogenase E1 component beta subunit